MYIMVFFDLPTLTKGERRVANRFRKDLINEGFFRMQLSCYARIVKGNDGSERYINIVQKKCPNKGSVRVMKVTDKQYAAMKVLIGAKSVEESLGKKQMLFF